MLSKWGAPVCVIQNKASKASLHEIERRCAYRRIIGRGRKGKDEQSSSSY